MSRKSSLDALVEAGLRALEELRALPPSERFDRLVRAGIIDERGRLLHQDGDPDVEVSIGELRASMEETARRQPQKPGNWEMKMSEAVSLSLSPDKRFLVGCPYDEAGSYAKVSPFKNLDFLVMHFTAGRSFQSTVAYFKSPANKVSAHLVVGRNGEMVQMVPFDRPAWHAGAGSTWRCPNPATVRISNLRPAFLSGMNFYALGIEFVNYGHLTKSGDKFVTWFGAEVSPSEVTEVDPGAPGAFGFRYWHSYTRFQLEMAEQLATLLVRGFDLSGVLGHSDILSTKTDPGPLFPLHHIASLALGMADSEETV